jgi:hypothetical protein
MTTRYEIQIAIAIQLAIHQLQEARRLLKFHVMLDDTITGVCKDIDIILPKLETHQSSLGSIFNAYSRAEP